MKKLSLKTAITLFFLILANNSIFSQTGSDKIIYIKHGTSYGMCKGYCYNETTYQKNNTITYSKYNDMGRKGTQPDKKQKIKTDCTKWKELMQSVNLTDFYKLPNKIGCPDCNDGGEEWIEIKTRKTTYRVTIEKGKPIPQIASLLETLRKE